MKKTVIILAGLFFSVSGMAQNVGIGNSSPSEKLDVTGNIKADTAKISSLILDNGFIKVMGANKSAFIVTTITGPGGNTAANNTLINYVNPQPTDILLVTHNWQGNYVGAIGVYFTGAVWRLFREDLTAMPNAEKFNVMVIKQ